MAKECKATYSVPGSDLKCMRPKGHSTGHVFVVTWTNEDDPPRDPLTGAEVMFEGWVKARSPSAPPHGPQPVNNRNPSQPSERG